MSVDLREIRDKVFYFLSTLGEGKKEDYLHNLKGFLEGKQHKIEFEGKVKEMFGKYIALHNLLILGIIHNSWSFAMLEKDLFSHKGAVFKAPLNHGNFRAYEQFHSEEHVNVDVLHPLKKRKINGYKGHPSLPSVPSPTSEGLNRLEKLASSLTSKIKSFTVKEVKKSELRNLLSKVREKMKEGGIEKLTRNALLTISSSLEIYIRGIVSGSLSVLDKSLNPLSSHLSSQSSSLPSSLGDNVMETLLEDKKGSELGMHQNKKCHFLVGENLLDERGKELGEQTSGELVLSPYSSMPRKLSVQLMRKFLAQNLQEKMEERLKFKK